MSKACERSFQEVNSKVTSSLVLTLLKRIDGFVAYCDASRIGIRCVFMQKRKVIAYVLRQFKIYEKNYPTHELELALVGFALKI